MISLILADRSVLSSFLTTVSMLTVLPALTVEGDDTTFSTLKPGKHSD